MSVSQTPTSPVSGQFIAEILSGSWRQNPVPAAVDGAQLDAHLTALSGSGAAALAWRRLRHSELKNAPSARTLQQIHLKQALDTKIHEKRLAKTFEKLRAAGVEPILTKGWASGRFYPEAGLRPVGDIDMLIQPRDIEATERVLGAKVDDDAGAFWDVKSKVPALYTTSLETIFEHQQRLFLGSTEIAVMGAEEHLRIHCLHFLKHGGWRPLWLCDIAAALEFRPADFIWERCLGQDPRSVDAIACTLGLAHRLIGANLDDTPVARRAARLPAWLVPAILKQWQTPQVRQHQPNPLLSDAIRARKGVVEAIFKRWPDPIYAAMKWQTPLDWPPFLAQTAHFADVSLFFLKRGATSASQPKT